MVTGDNLDTAIAIAKEASIITDSDFIENEDGFLCMTGKNFREIVGGIVTTHDVANNTTKDSVKNLNAFK